VEVLDKSVEANIKKDDVQTFEELKEECRLMELEQGDQSVEDVLIGQYKALREEVTKKDAKIVDMEQEIRALEIALRDHSHMTELEELLGVVHQKDERIEELEEALRESVRITAEREIVLQQEESRRKQIMEKVSDYKKQGCSRDYDVIFI
jgi:ELKS/RAB6-interacting/CAST family protein 1